jgi:hypothetical protein
MYYFYVLFLINFIGAQGSKYFKNEQRKSERVEREVQQMLHKLKAVEHQDDSALLRSIDAKLATLESSRDLTQVFFHIDMYARTRDRPRLIRRSIACSRSQRSLASANALLQGRLLRERGDQRQSAASRIAHRCGRQLDAEHGVLRGAQVWRSVGHAWIHRQAALPRAHHRPHPL